MAAEILQPSQTTIQPTQQEAPIPTNAFDVGAGVFGQAASDTVQAANVQGQRAAGLFDKANAYFDRTVDQYNKIAVMNAQDEAPGLIQKDGNGQIIPPTSFWPSGIHSLAYGQAYAEAARSTYRTMAGSEFSNFVSETQAKYPTDPAAFKKAVDDKQALMLQNLDPKEAPFISLRLQQIASQGGTQVAVNLQAANNATLKAQSDVSYAAIVDTASRLAGVAAPTAAFGGKDNAAVPGAISTITGSLDPEIQKRITSSDRTPEVNAQVGGATDSAHLKANTAVDIGTAGMTDEQKKALIGQVLASPNLRGIGFYDDHIHIDTGHDKHTVWGPVPSSVQNDVRNWQGTPTAMTAVPTSTDIEKIKTQVASSALVAGMLADWQKQAGPITTPAEIARKKDELAYTVVAKSYAETFKSARYDDGKGNIDQGKVALAEQNIEKIAQAFPGREDQVRKTLQEGMQFSVTQSSRFAAQQQLDDKRRIEPQQRRAMDLALQADALKNTDIDGARRITDQLRQEARAALNNPSINDAAALQLAQTYYTNGNLAKSSMQEGVTNKVQGLNAVTNDPAASPDQKAAAYESAKAIRNDPGLYNDMNAGQRNYLQGTMDTYVKNNFAGQMSMFHREGLAGNITPERIDQIRAEQTAKNMIPLEQVAQYSAIDEAMKKAWREKNTESTLAAQATKNHNDGVPSTVEQVAALKKQVGNPLKVPTMNFADPAHVATAQQTYQKFGIMPDNVKSALDAMPHSPNEADIAGQKALYSTITQVERAKVEKVMGTAYSEDKEGLIAQNVAAIVGKNAPYLELATLYDAQTANKMDVAFGSEASKAGALGQTADQAKQSVGAAVDTLMGTIQKAGLNVVSQTIDDPAAAWRSERDATPEQKALRAASGLAPDGGIGGYLKTIIPGFQGAGSYDNVVMDPNLRDALVRNGVVHMANDGKSIHAIRPGKGGVESFVAGTAFFTAARNGELGATVSDDGKTLSIGWKSLGNTVSSVLDAPVTPKMEQGFAAGLLQSENLRLGRTLTDIDPSRVFTTPYQAQNGQMRFRISHQDRNGNVLQMEDIAKEDPRIALQGLATFQAATQAVIANAADPETYGRVLAAGGVASGIGALALIKDGNVASNFVQMGSLIGNTIQRMQLALNRPGMVEAMLSNPKFLSPDQADARNNMEIGTQKLLQELSSELKKIPNSPDAKAALMHMIETHAPGTESTALQALVKGGFGVNPGAQPPIRTSPTRIGTDKP